MKVIFRKFKDDGEIIALFPEEPGTTDPMACSSYMHVGQHGAASEGVVDATCPAREEEYADLLAELGQIGYDDITIVHRFTTAHRTARKAALV